MASRGLLSVLQIQRREPMRLLLQVSLYFTPVENHNHFLRLPLLEASDLEGCYLKRLFKALEESALIFFRRTS